MIDWKSKLGKRNTKHRKPKNTPWSLSQPGIFKSHSQMIDGYDDETFQNDIKRKVRGVGSTKFPK